MGYLAEAERELASAAEEVARLDQTVAEHSRVTWSITPIPLTKALIHVGRAQVYATLAATETHD